MQKIIFITLIKWWCNCLDICFEITTRPWKQEELPYRRMICAVFDQPWKIKKSYSLFLKWKDENPMPTTWRETREQLIKFTRSFWEWDKIRRQITPMWPAGTVDYLEEFITDASKEYGELVGMEIIQAFRMINEVGDKFVPKPLVAEKLGIPDKRWLYAKVSNFAWHLRERKNGILKSFAFHGYTPTPDMILYWWRENKKMAAFEARLQEWGGNVPDHFLNMSVDGDDLNFSVRTYNCLKNANVQTLGELLSKTEEEMLRMKNFGRKSLNEIREVLHDLDPVFELGVLARKRHSGISF